MPDTSAFLRAFVRNPTSIGAVAPSSPALARRMVQCADLHDGDVVVELGAGTGPMTRALLAAPVPHELLVLEPDAELAARCRRNAPGADVVEAYAQDLPALLAERGWSRVDRVVSSLPFASFPADLQDAVFDAVLEVLASHGRMVTFTYAHAPWLPAGRRARRLLEQRFARVTTSPVVWTNTPPAFVYVCDRTAP